MAIPRHIHPTVKWRVILCVDEMKLLRPFALRRMGEIIGPSCDVHDAGVGKLLVSIGCQNGIHAVGDTRFQELKSHVSDSLVTYFEGKIVTSEAREAGQRSNGGKVCCLPSWPQAWTDEASPKAAANVEKCILDVELNGRWCCSKSGCAARTEVQLPRCAFICGVW